MRTLVDFLIEKKAREEKYFRDYLFWAKEIKEVAQENLGKSKVFLFGSIIRKQAEPGSDIDILIISPKLKTPEKKSEIRTKILEKIGNSSPFEIHLITPKEYQDWYSHFIKKEKVEIVEQRKSARYNKIANCKVV